MRKIKLKADTEITVEVIEYVLKKHKDEAKRIKLLQNYYDNNNDIMKRQYDSAANKPKNKLANPYASYITNTAVGYFLGKPVSYKNIDKFEAIQEAFTYNDESDVNTTLGENASVSGYAIELLYSDAEANARFTSVDPSECAIVYDNSLEENILFAIRYFDEEVIGEDEPITNIEVYTKDKIAIYVKKEDKISFVEDKEHFFLDVPVVVYANNNKLFGDFEKVKPLMDAYDKTQSDSANDFEMFTHAMLVISGYLADDADKEDINNKYVINFADGDGDAKYLIKEIQDAALENYKNRIDNDIHRFSGIPNMVDKEFSNNASGVSLSYKLMSLENITGVKESKFKKGLMRRIELLCNFYKIKTNAEMTYTEIEPTFTRNRPINDVEEADTMAKYSGILSEETILSMCSKVDNVQKELERKKDEQKMEIDENSSYFKNVDNQQENKVADTNE